MALRALHAGRAQPWLAALAIAAAGIAAYWSNLSSPFVYDDLASILHNPSIERLWPLSSPLAPPRGEGLTVEGRPILNLSLAVNYAIGGSSVGSYHVLNLLIHVLAGLALFGIVRRTALVRAAAIKCDPTLFAFLVALLWTLHPLQTEAVTYVIQRAEALMGLFYLLSLYCFVRMAEPPGRERSLSWTGLLWSALSILACLLGDATKETMVTAPVMILFYDRTFISGSFARAWRLRKVFYSSLAISSWSLLFVLLFANGGTRSGSAGFGVGVSFQAYLLTQFPALWHYLRLSLWPAPLVFEYGTVWFPLVQVVPYAVPVLMLAAATVWALVRKPVLGFLGFWFFGILAPTSLVPGTTQMIVEHRMYLPLAAPLVLLGLGLTRLMPASGTSGAPEGGFFVGRWLAVAGIVLACVLGTLTWERNVAYASVRALWADTAEKRPLNPLAHYNLGVELLRLGEREEAIDQFRSALRLRPDYAEAHNNLGEALIAAGRRAEAEKEFEAAANLKPKTAEFQLNWGNALTADGSYEQAMVHLQTASTIDPQFAEAHNGLGVSLLRLGRSFEAEGEFQKALAARPDYGEARMNLADALFREGRRSDALNQFEAVLRADPRNSEARLNFGSALAQEQRFPEAKAQFERVLESEPRNAKAHFNLGNVLLMSGDSRGAAREYTQTLQIDPAFAPAKRLLERLRQAGK